MKSYGKNKNFIIETHNLTKSYGNTGHTRSVVHQVDLAVPEGCIYGFLGPKGA